VGEAALTIEKLEIAGKPTYWNICPGWMAKLEVVAVPFTVMYSIDEPVGTLMVTLEEGWVRVTVAAVADALLVIEVVAAGLSPRQSR
jgi:hypothetical protein